MPTDAYLAHVDLAGSSQLDLDPGERWQLSQMLEDWFAFCIKKVVFSSGCAAAKCDTSWAGDGGFSLVTMNPAEGSDLPLAILSACLEFVELSPLVIGMPRKMAEPRPVRPLLRVLVAPLTVHHVGRISNAAGPELNQFLKYERHLTEVDAITVPLDFLRRLSGAEAVADGCYKLKLPGGRELLFAPKALADRDKDALPERLKSEEFFLVRTKPSRSFGKFTDAIEQLLLIENRWLESKLANSEAGAASFEALEPKAVDDQDALRQWCITTLQQLYVSWIHTPIGKRGVRISYFRRIAAADPTFELLQRLGEVPNLPNDKTPKFTVSPGATTSARDASVAWKVPVLIADATQPDALWDQGATRAEPGAIVSHLSLPIMAEQDVVTAVLCIDFACQVFPVSLTLMRDGTEQKAKDLWHRGRNDPLVQQVEAFANELRFGELEARYRSRHYGPGAST